MSDTHVWMHNADTDGTWACPAGLVEAYERRGWERCDAPVEDDSALYDAGDPRAQLVDETPDLDLDEDDEDDDSTDDPAEPGDPTPTTHEEQ